MQCSHRPRDKTPGGTLTKKNETAKPSTYLKKESTSSKRTPRARNDPPVSTFQTWIIVAPAINEHIMTDNGMNAQHHLD